MRSLLTLIAGILIGVAVDMAAQTPTQTERIVNQNPAPSPNKGIVGINHVGIGVPNVQEAYDYYTKTMGFTEISSNQSNGKVTSAFLRVSPDTFFELMQAGVPGGPFDPAERGGRHINKLGIDHFGLQVENSAAATAIFKERGANILSPTSPTVKIGNVQDPFGNRIEVQDTNAAIRASQNPAPSPNKGIVGINHLGIAVPNVQEAYDFYTKTMGFTDISRNQSNGKVTSAFLQVSPNAFLELMQAGTQGGPVGLGPRPVGFDHFGLLVEDWAAATTMFKERGANILQPRIPTVQIRN